LLAPKGEARRNTMQQWEALGGDASRLRFFDPQPRQAYLEGYRQIDVCLDTLPYNGHTTTLDALWMGVPTVTLVGETVVGRAGLSLATNIGLPEFVARTADEYVDRAQGVTRDVAGLAELRRGLRARLERSPLMDGPRFARNLESAYRSIWQTWCETQHG
jgi:predicted O-linked N-acetylglucosamine transferase (SPINDLY family)